jgi:hypothetical protein
MPERRCKGSDTGLLLTEGFRGDERPLAPGDGQPAPRKTA